MLLGHPLRCRKAVVNTGNCRSLPPIVITGGGRFPQIGGIRCMYVQGASSTYTVPLSSR